MHVLWECPAHNSIWDTFMGELENLIGKHFVEQALFWGVRIGLVNLGSKEG